MKHGQFQSPDEIKEAIEEMNRQPQLPLSLRDQFALHAPMPPPGWFKPEFTDDAKTAATIHPALNAIAMENYRRSKLAAESLLQWPYAWADMQLAERERRKS